MAGDTTVQTDQGKERRRDLGGGVTAPVAVGADADGAVYTVDNPAPVVVIDSLAPQTISAVSDTLGDSMHLADGSFGGIELEVYTADAVLWTATAEVGPGNFTAVSNEQNHTDAGTNSAKWDGPSTGDIIQFEDPAAPQDLSGYVALTFWIYIASGYSAGNTITVSGWDGATVGTPSTIELKIDQNLQGAWQLVAFDLEELGLDNQSINAIRLQFSKTAAPTVVYIDDVGFQQTGGAEVFEIRAEPGTVFVIDDLFTVFVDDVPATLTDGTLPGLDPLKLMGLDELTNGNLFELIIGGEVTLIGVFHNLCDFLANNAEMTSGMALNGNTCVKFVRTFKHGVELRGDEEDLIRFTVRDDLRGLTRMLTTADGGVRPA